MSVLPTQFNNNQRDLRKHSRHRRRLATSDWGALLLSTFLTLPVSANVIGSDTQNFNPTTSGLDFVTVESSETLAPGVINFGLFVNQAVNTLPYFETEEQGRLKYSDTLVGGDIHLGIGLMKHWDIGVSAPQILHQEVESEGFRGQFAENGNTEIRFNTKLRLFGDSRGGVAIIGTANLNRLQNNPYLGKDGGPVYGAQLVMDTTVSRIALALNLGYRFRDPGEPLTEELPDNPIVPVDDQYIASAAASYHFASIDTKLIAEVFGSAPVQDEDEASDRVASSSEALLGMKYDFTHTFAGHLGGGTELSHGRSSPDWRVYAGINYATGSKFSRPRPRKPSAKDPKKDPFAGPPRAVEKIVIHDVLFEFDSDNRVLPGARDTLRKLVNYMLLKPSYTRLVIEGHTDSIGSYEYNRGLSSRRANTIRSRMIKLFRLDPKKIRAIGRGERYPVAENANFQGRQLNRRVEFTIYRDM